MAYQIFALKWRPQNFDQIVGQNHAVSLLKNSISKKRLAYAYLFAGPRGVGKTSTARILAKSLNCKEGPTIKPCQMCTACQEITGCRSLDVLEIDGASNRGIDEIRALRESVRFNPSGGRFKIYIIDEVHMLTNEAFNALLKTLEEPPEFVKFIFATTQVNRIPATILSRCQRLDFRRIPVLDIITQLKKIVAKEKINLEDEVLFTIARASDGSLRDAESILDQLTSFTKDKISTSDVSSLLGVLEQEMIFEITERIIKQDIRGALDLLNTMLRQGKDNHIILNNMIEHFRNLIMAKISSTDYQLIDLPPEIIKKLIVQSQHFSLVEIFNIFNLLVSTQEMSKKMDSSIIPLEINLIRLIQEKKTDVQLIKENPASSQAKANPTRPAPESKESSQRSQSNLEKSNPNQQSNKSTDDELGLSGRIKENWPKIIDNLSKVKMSVATFLSEGTPIKLESDTLIISFPESCSLHKETLQRKENRLLIEKTLSQFLNQNLKIKFVLSVSDSKNEHPEEKNKNDSFVHSVINAFNARLV
ncbi:MAG: DNA polymerase III subunit gamma/tau [Candidatus Omnitrophota bacterium]|jgi:DNA polymerase-3 subunit gamma/tau